jgi:hypothetical protein
MQSLTPERRLFGGNGPDLLHGEKPTLVAGQRHRVLWRGVPSSGVMPLPAKVSTEPDEGAVVENFGHVARHPTIFGCFPVPHEPRRRGTDVAVGCRSRAVLPEVE